MGFLCALPLSVSRFTVAAACLPPGEAAGSRAAERVPPPSSCQRSITAELPLQPSLLPAVQRHAARWVAATACLRAGGRSTPAVPFAVLSHLSTHLPSSTLVLLADSSAVKSAEAFPLRASVKVRWQVSLHFFLFYFALICRTVLVNAAADFVANRQPNAAKC